MRSGYEDPLEEAQIQQILLQNGVLTVNEVRRMRGLAEFGKAFTTRDAELVRV